MDKVTYIVRGEKLVKKIVFVNSSLTDGGSEKVMTLLANQMVENGYEVTMILVRNKKRTYEINSKINCIQLNYKFNNKLFIMGSRILKLRSIFKEINPDVVISFMVDINIMTLLASLGLKIKIIVSERANPFIREKKFIKIGEKALYPLADKVVVQTDMVKEYFNDKIQKKCVTIPNPINVIKSPISQKVKEKKIIAVGRMTEQKNFKMLIDAYYLFSKENLEYDLYIYGEGPLRQQLIEYTQKLGITNRVNFPGYVKNMNEIMSTSSLYISSSNFEGISNAMLEALALGIPSICTDCPVGGASLVIENNKNGILIPVNDVNALYLAINKVINNKIFAEKISKEALKINDIFSLKNITKKWEKVIESLKL